MERDLFGAAIPPAPPPNPDGRVWWQSLSELLDALKKLEQTPPNVAPDRRESRLSVQKARRACAVARAAAGVESERQGILPRLSAIDRTLQRVTALMLAGGPQPLPPDTPNSERLRRVLAPLWAIAGDLTGQEVADELKRAAQLPRPNRTAPAGYGDAQSLAQDLRGLGVCATAKLVYQYLKRNEEEIELAVGSKSWRIRSANGEQSPGGRAKRGRSEAEWTFSRAVVMPRLIEHFG